MSHESYDPGERRKFVRVDIYAVTRYFCPVRNQEIGVQTRISDISEGGVKLVTFEDGIPIDTIVTMSFQLPHKEGLIVTIEGQVRYSGFLEQDLFRSGVEFTKVHKKHLQAINDYIASKHK